MTRPHLKDVGVGGTAFRQKDAQYMSYFPRMYAHFLSLLPTGAGGMKVMTVGTGIAAGADLMPVLAFNEGIIPSVTFYCPGWFDVDKAVFIAEVGGKAVGYKRDVDAANFYHQKFKEGTGIDGRAEIAKALSTEARRATIYNYWDFFQRNAGCAQDCLEFWAYSCAPEVKGGTKNAWNAHERVFPRTSTFFNVLTLPEVPPCTSSTTSASPTSGETTPTTTPPSSSASGPGSTSASSTSSAITDFHSPGNECYSSFYPCQIAYGNIHFGSVENAYQAAKCEDEDDMLQFVNITPGQAKRLGRKVKMRPDWDEAKIPIMAQLVWQKFQQSDLKEKLLATGDAELIEGNTWGDKFWGKVLENGEWVGENWLGIILMKTRETLRRLNG